MSAPYLNVSFLKGSYTTGSNLSKNADMKMILLALLAVGAVVNAGVSPKYGKP
jgi:hypothetical protein